VKWFKGNIHTHTNESDGDSDPKTVVNFFVELNYDFLVLSDHNHLTVLDYGNKHPDILMIPGEEVTIREPFNIHMGAIGINSYVEPIYGNDSIDTIRANTNAIHSAGGIAVLNHPNFKWALNEKIIHKVNELKFFEVFNGDSATNNLGNENSKSTEEIWDYLLSNGKLIFGVATDDSHHYKKFSSLLSNPGRGWIMVKAESRVQADILDNFAKGNFYSSTGVFISDILINKNEISLDIDTNPEDYIKENPEYHYKTQFIGKDGIVLHETWDLSPTYIIKGQEKYVRVVITGSSGHKAWTQPMFIN
jgi:hypothetical protein